MLKEQLLEEAKNLDASVELDSVFESVELSPEVKENFSVVFEATVKNKALQLAESHIQAIAEKAEKEVEKNKEEAEEKAEKELKESASKFFDYLAGEWLAENQLAVDKGIKADLFESMFSGLKELFVEHNVSLPAESVDVVAELEEALAEEQAQTAALFESNNALTAEVAGMKRAKLIEESTRELTESQKEKVASLVEGTEFSDSFSGKLNSIVSMVVASTKSAQTITESADINNIEDDAAKLNFVTEAVEETNKTATQSPSMNAYTRAATRLG